MSNHASKGENQLYISSYTNLMPHLLQCLNYGEDQGKNPIELNSKQID